MRITGGVYRGRELASPRSDTTHPMGSRERLALFNSLQAYLTNAKVLDLYAGTGALGLEALSRGAATATFVEKNHRAASILRQNIADLGLIAQTTLIEGNVENFQPDHQFDLIFVDPPYDNFSITPLINLTNFLAPDGLLVISHPADFNPSEFAVQSHLELISTKSYAAARISTFKH